MKLVSMLLKQVLDLLHRPLLHILTNPCKVEFFQISFPPLFKKGSDSELGNYRPISILLCFSKILEKIMYNHFYKHLNENNILYKKQFGFQQKHSTLL